MSQPPSALDPDAEARQALSTTLRAICSLIQHCKPTEQPTQVTLETLRLCLSGYPFRNFDGLVAKIAEIETEFIKLQDYVQTLGNWVYQKPAQQPAFSPPPRNRPLTRRLPDTG